MPKVRLLTVGLGGDSPAIRFTDNFNRALLGAQNWQAAYGVSGNLGCDTITCQFLITGGTQLTLQNTGAGSNFNGILLPLPTVGVAGKVQFAQVTHANVPTVQGVAGAGVMYSGDAKVGMNGYFLGLDGAAGIWRIRRIDPPTYTTLFSLAPLAAPGDIIRLSAIPEAGLNTLITTLNGVVIDTRTDSLAARPVFQGVPALIGYNCVAAHSYLFDDWVSGSGT